MLWILEQLLYHISLPTKRYHIFGQNYSDYFRTCTVSLVEGDMFMGRFVPIFLLIFLAIRCWYDKKYWHDRTRRFEVLLVANNQKSQIYIHRFKFTLTLLKLIWSVYSYLVVGQEWYEIIFVIQSYIHRKDYNDLYSVYIQIYIFRSAV